MASLTERQARVLAREQARAEAVAAAAAKRAARKKEPKPIVDPPRYNPPMSTMPVYENRVTGGIAGAATVNPVYNTYN